MIQLEIYKKALRILEKAMVSTDRRGYAYWTTETYLFWALCRLILDISTRNPVVITRFKRDSEKLLGRELDGDDLWFTTIETDEPKARAERLEHLQNLIKLYEDEKTIKKY